MSAPISIAIRKNIVVRYKNGERISCLARAYKVSRGSIYSFIKMAQSEATQSLEPQYDNCGKVRPQENQFVFRAVRCLRTWHPSWGAEKIRAEILGMRPQLKLPHYRTFNRWFHWNNQIEVFLKSTLPKSIPKRAKRLHEGWQIDAKEEMVIADGSQHCWLNITDEYSGTVIDPIVFPL